MFERRIAGLLVLLVALMALLSWPLLSSGPGPTRRGQPASALKLLADRTTPDGIRVELSRGVVQVDFICDHPASRHGTCPEKAAGIEAVLSYRGQRTVISLFSEFVSDAELIHVINAGGTLSPRVQWSAIQTSAGVASIRVKSHAGHEDEVRPVQGYAFFATTTGFGVLEARDATGTVIMRCTVPVPGAPCQRLPAAGSLGPHP